MIAPQPSATHRVATPSDRSALVNVALAGSVSGKGAISVNTSRQPNALSDFTSTPASAPEAPVGRHVSHVISPESQRKRSCKGFDKLAQAAMKAPDKGGLVLWFCRRSLLLAYDFAQIVW
jgi:hypothetical protein